MDPKTAEAELQDLLKLASFDQLLEAGHVLDIETAASRTGYSPQHLRRLCADRRIAHVQRNGAGYYFLPAQIEGVFKAFEPEGAD